MMHNTPLKFRYLLLVAVIFLALGMYIRPAFGFSFGQMFGDSTVNTLDPWKVVTGYITPRNAVNGLKVPALVSCNTIDTDSNGVFSCGTDEGGAGGGWATSSADYWATTDLKLQELSDVQDPNAYGLLLMWTGSLWATTSTSSLGIVGAADGNWSTTSADYWDTTKTARTADDLSDNTTSDLAEGTNLYWTSARATSAVSALIAATTTTAIDEGSNLYYTDLRVGDYITGSTTLCVFLTGSASLCDGSDASGTGGTGLATSTPIADTYVIYGTSPADVGAEAAFTYSSSLDKLTVTNASTTNLSTATSIELFGGGAKTTANALCIQLTGAAALCDSGDDTGTDSADDLSNNSIEDLNDVAAMTEVAGDVLYWTGSTWSNTATSSWTHALVTLAGQDYLTLSGQQITAGEIQPDDLANADFGEFGCNGTTCTLDSEVYSIQELSDVTDAITENYGDLLGWSGTAWIDFATSSLGISWNDLRSVPAGFADGVDDTGSSVAYLASTTPWTAGQLASVVDNGTLTSVATGTLTEGVTGLEFSATGNLVGSAAVLNLSTGYSMFLTASGTNWNTFYDTPSNRITGGNGLTWSGNTLNFDGGDTPGGELGGTWASPTLDANALSLEELSDVNDTITETLGDLLYWTGTQWSDIATSSLNISTTNLVEGTNLFYTDVRVGNYILGSTTLQLNGDLRVAGGDITLGATSIFSGGDTASLNNIDAIDATTETTFEAALDTFTNGLTVGTFFALVSGTAPTVDAAGEMALDTTDDQLILADGGGTARVFGHDEWRIISVTLASTSVAFTSGQTLPALSHKDGLEITQYTCYVVGGTSKVLNLTDGTNDTETITCGTTLTSDTDVATNDTFTAGELGYMEMGATTGTVNYLHFEAYARITRE